MSLTSLLRKKLLILILSVVFVQPLFFSATAQMRQVYLDSDADNEISKISFYSPSQGYVGFFNWIGFTSDSGHTFTQKHINIYNVNFNGYFVNLTFGFYINGVKAFDQNHLLTYGHYGLVPAILYSSDGGNSFTLVFHSQYDNLQLSGGVTDMIFPQNNSVGFACDPDRILKTTDGGLTWTVLRTDPGSFFTNLEAIDNSNIFAFSTDYSTNRLIKTTNGGSSWQAVVFPSIPQGKMTYAHFRTATNGWLSMSDDDSKEYFYKTTNGGSSWALQNDVDATPFNCGKMKFFDDNTGYALAGQNTVFKTVDGGKTWEPLARDNSFAYLGYTHNDIFFVSSNQFWAGGGHGFLELTTNGGGTPIPTAYFKVDTTGFASTGNVSLVDFSRSGYSYKWIVNNQQVSTSYNATYTHEIFHIIDTIQLIVSNGAISDTETKYQFFYPPVIVSSFTPTQAAAGAVVTITGLNFTNVSSVSFGGVPAGSFTVQSATTIKATVGAGASGSVKVITQTGSGSLVGFTFIPPPAITSFTPTSATAGTTVTITGSNFATVSQVKFGGVPGTSFTVISSTTITAVTPSGPSGTVSVTTSGGTASLIGYSSLPSITYFTPVKGTQGTIMKIVGSCFSEVNSVTVGGVAVQSFTVKSPDTIIAVVSTGATGSVVVSKPAGSASLPGFTWFPPPIITSFSPVTGPVGTSVTINGTNFNPTPANNTVYFGNVKATIIAGSSTSLNVTVPPGASLEPITVLNNNLIAYSDKPFQVSFPNGASITDHSFSKTTISTLPDNPAGITLGDVDGDGKSDIVLSKLGYYVIQSGLLIYRNTSTDTTISFDVPINMTTYDCREAQLGDLDGDGKLDIAATDGYSIVTFVNTSTPGNISFTLSAVLPATNSPHGIAINDVDGDGKADIAVCQYPDAIAYVYRNTSEPGSLSFAAPVGYTVYGAGDILLVDIDGDKKPEMIVPNFVDEKVAVFKNNCTKGNISFSAPLNIPGYADQIAAGDMDGDGKTDLVFNDGDSRIDVIRNTGTVGAISFATPVELNATTSAFSIKLSDLDGDGKLDIGVALLDFDFSIYKNTSAPGNLSFAPHTDYEAGFYNGTHQLTLGDLNNDGKDDAVVLSETNRSLSIYTNNVLPEPFVTSFTPTIGEAGTTVTITGNNFLGVTAVKFGGVDAASFTINSDNSITAVVAGGGSGTVAVTNSYGTVSLGTFVYGIGPTITSFSPTSADVGSTVTITGNRFSLVDSENIVYFGGVRAQVIEASATSLTAIVPYGATHQSITVTVNNRTAYSPKKFVLTFPGGSSSFSATSFAPRMDRPGGASTHLSDLDGDGKLDLLVLNGTTSVNVARNLSSGGNLTFSSNIGFPLGVVATGYVTGDLDGDGKLDVVTYNYDYHSISILKNTSTPANISLSAATSYYTGPSATRPSDAAICDLDGDGWPDIVVANYYSKSIAVFRNLGVTGAIAFGTRMDIGSSGYPTGISVNDMDGDGKPELVVSVNSDQEVAVFRNTSIPGTISFAPKAGFGTGSWPEDIAVGDLDGDGKLDMAVCNINSKTISLYRNLSSPGNISFTSKQDFVSGDGPMQIEIGDLDGDGKPDVVEQNVYSGQTISIFKNTSTPGNISLAPKFDYAMGGDNVQGSIGDLDGDGRPDVAICVLGGTTAFLRNVMGQATVLQACPGSSLSITSNRTGTSYQWQQNSGAGFVNISDNSNYSGTNTVTLKLNNIPSGWNAYQYQCIVDGAQSNVFSLELAASITPSVLINSSAITFCAGTNVTFTATPTNGGSTPSYQWKVNGINVGSNSTSYSTTTLSNNAAVNVLMTSNANCANPATVTSNNIAVSVIPIVIPTISISGTTVLDQGQSTLLHATGSNGGSSPSYRWQDSTFTHTWQDISGATTTSLNYLPNATGVKVRGILTNNDSCVSPHSVMSAVLTFTINTPTAINPVTLTNYNLKLYPNPVTSILTIDSLKLSDRWEYLNITSVDGKHPVIIKNIFGQTSVAVHVDWLQAGVYIITLNKKSGEIVSMRFVKY